MATCYMCDSIATSREHAPPRCFFPEAKAIGRDLRLNLITVPSCDFHNSEKSEDDEFLRSVILMSKNNNAAGRHLFWGKLLRAAKESPLIYNSFFIDKGTISQGRDHLLQLDRSRFDSCIDYMARALFFDAFTIKWQLPISIVSSNFFSNIQTGNVVPHQPAMDLAEALRIFLQDEPVRGSNPEVFKYQLRYDEAANAFALASIFYDCFKVYTFSSMALADKV